MQFRGAKVVLYNDVDLASVKDMLHQAWLDLQNMKMIHGTDDFMAQLRGGGKWQVLRVAGVDIIRIYAPPGGVGVKKKKKRIIKKKRVKFLPAIFLFDINDVASNRTVLQTNEYWDYPADVSICPTSKWEGVKYIQKDQVMINYPLTKMEDIPTKGIKSCKMNGYAGYDWYITYDWEEDDDSTTDSGFSPMPYLGYDYSDGGEDYLMGQIVAVAGGLYQWYIGTPSYCGETDLLGLDWPDDSYHIVTGHTHFGIPDDWESPCGDEPRCDCTIHIASRILASSKCGYGHLMSKVNMASIYDVATFDLEYLMGFCVGPEIDCTYDVNTYFMRRSVGSTQHRVIEDNYEESYPVIDDEFGITLGDFGYGWKFYTRGDYRMLAPCSTNYTYVWQNGGIEIWPSGYCGAIIRPDICDAKDENIWKYMGIYIEDVYQSNVTRSGSPWPCSGFGYDPGGEYDHGICGPGPVGDIILQELEDYYNLAVVINGEKIVIDTLNPSTDGIFTVTDSHIFECMGKVIYMYAYCLYMYVAPKGVRYTRYGYFVNDIKTHVQSEKFYPSGDYYGEYMRGNHDVFGSEDRDDSERKYGWGKCWGYFTLEEIEEEVDDL